MMFFFVNIYMLYLQSNPISRWHICEGSINNIVYSADGTYLATVGRDGNCQIARLMIFMGECMY
jgi:hypothetical protein